MTKMKQAAVALALAGCMTAFADGQKPDPRQTTVDARARFENANGPLFMGSRLTANGAAPDELRFDNPHATGSWSIILPLSDDARVRFLDVAPRFQERPHAPLAPWD
jgi:hypothetical protein